MKHTVEMFKDKLESEIKETVHGPLTSVTLKTAESLGRAWLLYDDIWCRLDSYAPPVTEGEKPMHRLTEEDIQAWNDNMKNADGTTGGHWTVEQTTSVAKSVGVYFEHITPMEFNVAMNMMYSDYYMVLSKYGVDSAAAYGDLAKAFLFDRDGGKPADKLTRYYCWVVKPNK